jgi:hypothetical protein
VAVCFQESWCTSKLKKTRVAKTSQWLYREGFVNKVYGNFQTVFSFGINVCAVWRASEDRQRDSNLCDVVKHTPHLTSQHSNILYTHTHSCFRFLSEFCLCFYYIRISFIKCEANSQSEIYQHPLKVIWTQMQCFQWVQNRCFYLSFTFI